MTGPILHRDDPDAEPLTGNIKVTRQDWLNLAMDVLVSDGVERVKVLVLADRMGVSRSSFYWYFKSRQDLLDALLQEWQATNTAAIVGQAETDAPTVTAAVLNVWHCVANPGLFNTALDFAIRDWARRSGKVSEALDFSDARRLLALTAMFARYGYPEAEAASRARALYYMQIGYDLADPGESMDTRMARVADYLLIFTGKTPEPGEVADFADYAKQFWNEGDKVMTQTYDAIIIGTGVIGAAIAFEMAKAGRKTLSLDRNAQAGHGSTAGSCAIIRMHYSTFDGTAFAWEGYHYWRDWAEYLGLPADTPLAPFRETGCMVMKTEGNGHLEKHMANSAALDCPFEDWSAEDVRKHMPIYALDSYAPAKRQDHPDFGKPNGATLRGAVYWPNAGYVTDPAFSAQNLMAAAEQHGAKVLLNAEVTEILSDNGRAAGVRLSDGTEISAAVVVNVAGPGSAHINQLAGVTGDMTIETRPLRQEVTHVPSPEGFDFEHDGMIVSDSDISVYVRPEHGNHILIGSEDPECDPHQWCADDKDYDRNFTDQWTTQALRYAQRVPSLGIPSKMRGVVDLYDASTDWIPIYDKSSLPGFYMACGTSGNQFKNAPIAGKLMAALIDYCEAGNDHDANPLQFELPYLGREIDAGFYSRKREINSESSFSVLG